MRHYLHKVSFGTLTQLGTQFLSDTKNLDLFSTTKVGNGGVALFFRERGLGIFFFPGIKVGQNNSDDQTGKRERVANSLAAARERP